MLSGIKKNLRNWKQTILENKYFIRMTEQK